MPRALINSALVAFLVAVVTVVLGSSTGYALARIRFRGADTVSVALLLGQLLPVTVLLLPLFQLVVELQLIDQIPGLGLAQLVLVLPLVCWLIASAFRGVPFELEEAAMIDGCSRLGAITRVVLPVAAPGIAAAGSSAPTSPARSWSPARCGHCCGAPVRRSSTSPPCTVRGPCPGTPRTPPPRAGSTR